MTNKNFTIFVDVQTDSSKKEYWHHNENKLNYKIKFYCTTTSQALELNGFEKDFNLDNMC